MRVAAFSLLFCIGIMGPDSARAVDQYELAESRGCLACHQLDVKVVGPPFKKISRMYKGDETAESRLVDKVVKGGVGVWGTMPMHAGNVTSEDASILVKWILGMS